MPCVWFLTSRAATCVYGFGFVLCCVVLSLLGELYGNFLLENCLICAVTSIGISVWRNKRNNTKDNGARYEQVQTREEEEEERQTTAEASMTSLPLDVEELTVEEASNNDDDVPAALPTLPISQPRSPRLHYMDNLKSILTALVVIHHSTLACGAGPANSWFYGFGNYYHPTIYGRVGNGFLLWNQSYFMVLFYFVAGIFSAASLETKPSRVRFLADRYKRLFVPFLVFFFALCPLLSWTVFQLVGYDNNKNGDDAEQGSNDFTYFPFAGHTWFVFWLLLFSIMHASVTPPKDDANTSASPNELPEEGSISPRRKGPSVCQILCGGLVLGLFQGLLVTGLGVGLFVFMPLTIGSLPFDTAAFYLGIQARNNDWLELDLAPYFFGSTRIPEVLDGSVNSTASDPSDCQQHPVTSSNELVRSDCLHVDTPCCQRRRSTIWFMMLLSLSVCMGFAFVGDRRSKDDSTSLVDLLLFFGFFGVMGVACVVMCTWWLFLAMHKFNTTSPVLTWISRAAYGVYLIHPFVVVAMTAVYIQFLNAIHAVPEGGVIAFPDNVNMSPTKLRSEVYLWLGWIVVSASSLLCSWILAGCLKRLPIVRKVL